jgi:hypothetical protein
MFHAMPSLICALNRLAQAFVLEFGACLSQRAALEQRSREAPQVRMFFHELPVEPADFIILAVAVVVAALGTADFVSITIIGMPSESIVTVNFDNTANFSQFKTYKWITLNSVAPIDKLTDEQIKAALDAGLARKGLTKVDADNADLLIGYQTTGHISKQFGGRDSPWSIGPA